MRSPFTASEAPRTHLNALDRTQLFVGRAVTGAVVAEGAGAAINAVGKAVDSDFLYSDPGNTAIAAAALGLLYAVRQRRNPAR